MVFIAEKINFIFSPEVKSEVNEYNSASDEDPEPAKNRRSPRIRDNSEIRENTDKKSESPKSRKSVP